MSKKLIKDLDIAVTFFNYHERGENDIIRDMFLYIKEPGPWPTHPAFTWYWSSIFQHFIDEGYMFIREGAYITTVKGKLFWGAPKWIFKNKPFAYLQFKKRLNIAWKIAIIIASVVNAGVVLWLTWKQSTCS